MSKFDSKTVASIGKAAFYACVFADLSKVANGYGWALGLHGSLQNDMDIMAMPWTEDAKPVEKMIRALSNLFSENPYHRMHMIPHYGKPNGRVTYSINIWSDFFLDINCIDVPYERKFVIGARTGFIY